MPDEHFLKVTRKKPVKVLFEYFCCMDSQLVFYVLFARGLPL